MPANENLGKFLPLSENFAEMMLEFGYLHLQATKPDTIGKLSLDMNKKLIY
jgi:hypothetical protein